MATNFKNRLDKKHLRSVLHDYVIEDLSTTELSKKYAYSRTAIGVMLAKFDAYNLREKYHSMIIQKGMSEGSDHAAIILNASRKIMAKYMTDIVKDFTDASRVTKTDFESAAKAFQIFQKEYRLDHDEPTENIISKVEVEFVSMAPVITDNDLTKGQDIIDVTPIEKPPDIERRSPRRYEEPKPEAEKTEVESPLSGADTILDEMP